MKIREAATSKVRCSGKFADFVSKHPKESDKPLPVRNFVSGWSRSGKATNPANCAMHRFLGYSLKANDQQRKLINAFSSINMRLVTMSRLETGRPKSAGLNQQPVPRSCPDHSTGFFQILRSCISLIWFLVTVSRYSACFIGSRFK